MSGTFEQEWIVDRFRAYQERIEKQHREQGWRENARASYSSMFDALAEQVKSDVHFYTLMFNVYSDCAVSFLAIGEGFQLQKGVLSIIVKRKPGTTIIEIETARLGQPSTSRHFEVSADLENQGNVGYLSKGVHLDVVGASRDILDSIFCK